MRKSPRGFTLIELMVTVVVIGLLAAVAAPRFASLSRKASEGTTKGNLGTIRSAISVYYCEQPGWFPAPTASGTTAVPGSLGSILTMANGKYIEGIPAASCPPYHGKSDVIEIGLSSAGESASPGAWGYKVPHDAAGNPRGDIWVNCTHTDTKNVVWGLY